MSRRILVADDSSTIQKVIKIAFSRFDTEMVEAASYVEALGAVARVRPLPDLLIIDASLPGARGPQDFKKLMQDCQGAPLLLLVGTYEAVDETEFREAGFQHFLKKPFESSDLISLADKLLNGKLTSGAAAVAKAAPPPPAYERHSTTIIVPPLPKTGAGRDPSSAEFSREAYGADFDTPTGQHILSVQDGGADAGGDDAGPQAHAPVPPPPLTDESRKGRRAFEIDEMSSSGQASAPDTTMRVRRPSPLPPIPPGTGTFSDSQPSNPHQAVGAPAGGSMTTTPPPRSAPVLKSTDAELSEAAMTAALLPFLEEKLPVLVREALEEYCERHFKSLAREIIASELRRLADEKARHLVDN